MPGASGIASPTAIPRPRVVSGELSSEAKFAVVIDSASLNEVDLSEYCRRKGLYPEQIHAWRKTCIQANAAVVTQIDDLLTLTSSASAPGQPPLNFLSFYKGPHAAYRPKA